MNFLCQRNHAKLSTSHSVSDLVCLISVRIHIVQRTSATAETDIFRQMINVHYVSKSLYQADSLTLHLAKCLSQLLYIVPLNKMGC